MKAPAAVMIGDSDAFVEVTPRDAGGVSAAAQKISFARMPAGVALEPQAGGAADRVEGPTRFRLTTSPSAIPGPLTVEIRRHGDAQVVGAANLYLQKTVSQFELLPAGMTVPRVGEPVRFQVLAKDEDGALVTAYHGGITLTSSAGRVREADRSGALFNDGIALIDVVFDDRDSRTSMNRLTVRARAPYAGQSAPAEGSIDVQLEMAR